MSLILVVLVKNDVTLVTNFINNNKTHQLVRSNGEKHSKYKIINVNLHISPFNNTKELLKVSLWQYCLISSI